MQGRLPPFFALLAALGAAILLASYQEAAALDSSVPYVGGQLPVGLGYDGSGIVIGIIDTGVDDSHPDLAGPGGESRVTKLYNFFDGGPLRDVNGHGTGVAGIIAADGDLQGVAPGARIISYKVSDDGESVSSDLIIRAIEQAVADGVDIINISLGVNRTNPRIDLAVDGAVGQGVVVVVAAGNDGPDEATIGSPGINRNAITVGATYNNLTSSLVATLEAGGMQYRVIPMVATPAPEAPVDGPVAFGLYARERDLEGGLFAGAIVLAERGSDTKGEIVYFSDKEQNAADAGAAALIIYNNEPGIYLGELDHEYAGEGYVPRIPTVSISREDGLEIREKLAESAAGALRIFYDPDHIVHFSSRGPLSPFYAKPDLVAPGIFVNTTLHGGGYNSTSGTSFAAPHVSGAAALLLQKNPHLTPEEIGTILATTADPISDAYGEGFGLEAAGSGRLNVTRAFGADLVFSRHVLAFDLARGGQPDRQAVTVDTVGGGQPGEYSVSFDVQEGITMNHQKTDGGIMITAEIQDGMYGRYEGRMEVKDPHTTYGIPIIIHSTRGSITTYEEGGTIGFDILGPEDWTYAKISVTNARTGETDTVSARPDSPARLPVSQNGTYWVEAAIHAGGQTLEAYDKIEVGSAAAGGLHPPGWPEIPARQVAIMAAVGTAVAAAGIGLASRGSAARRPGSPGMPA